MSRFALVLVVCALLALPMHHATAAPIGGAYGQQQQPLILITSSCQSFFTSMDPAFVAYTVVFGIGSLIPAIGAIVRIAQRKDGMGFGVTSVVHGSIHVTAQALPLFLRGTQTCGSPVAVGSLIAGFAVHVSTITLGAIAIARAKEIRSKRFYKLYKKRQQMRKKREQMRKKRRKKQKAPLPPKSRGTQVSLGSFR